MSPDVRASVLLSAAELLLDALPPLKANTRFLELGSGDGVLSRPLAERIVGLARLVTVDVTTGFSTKGRVAHTVSHAARLPFIDGAFDAVLANLCIDLGIDDASLREAHRVLRRGGTLLVTALLEENLDVSRMERHLTSLSFEMVRSGVEERAIFGAEGPLLVRTGVFVARGALPDGGGVRTL